MLSMPDGPIDAVLAEQNALAQMERLRPHQLLHPELVTEGMNKLAQALLALLEEAPPTAVVAVTPFKPPLAVSKPAVIPSPQELDSSSLALMPAIPSAFAPASAMPQSGYPAYQPWQPVDLEPVAPGLPPREPADPLESIPSREEILDAEVVVDVEPDSTPSGGIPRGGSRRSRSALAAVAPPPGTVYVPQDRRAAYRQLVLYRHLLEAWEKLAPFANQPQEQLTTATRIHSWLEACQQYRQVIARVKQPRSLLRSGGQILDALARSDHAAQLLRGLQPDQRERLAVDWLQAQTAWQTEAAAIRDHLRTTVPRNRLKLLAGDLGDSLRAYPEWVLVFLSLLALSLALVRQMVR
jgi:hypothetical protein